MTSAKAAKVLRPDVTLPDQQCRAVNHNTAFMLAHPDLAFAPAREIEAELSPHRWRVTRRPSRPRVIANHGRGALNLLTILARVNFPFMGSYCGPPKAAALSLNARCCAGRNWAPKGGPCRCKRWPPQSTRG